MLHSVGPPKGARAPFCRMSHTSKDPTLFLILSVRKKWGPRTR